MILRVSSSAQQLNLRHPKENCRQQQNVVLFFFFSKIIIIPSFPPHFRQFWHDGKTTNRLKCIFQKTRRLFFFFSKTGGRESFLHNQYDEIPTNSHLERECILCTYIPRAGGIDPFATGAIRSVPSLSYSLLPHPIKENQKFGLYNFLIP